MTVPRTTTIHTCYKSDVLICVTTLLMSNFTQTVVRHKRQSVSDAHLTEDVILKIKKQCCSFFPIQTETKWLLQCCAHIITSKMTLPVQNIVVLWLPETEVPESIFIPPHNEVVGGGLLVSLRPSIRPSVPHPVSALQHLQFCLDPFHIYTYQATSEGVSCVKFLAKF